MAGSEDIKVSCNWPIRVYLIAMFFAIFTLALFTPALDGHWRNAMRGGMQALVLLVFLGRYLLARHRREQSKAWIPYVVIMFLAAPLWLLAEPVFFELLYFGRRLMGGAF